MFSAGTPQAPEPLPESLPPASLHSQVRGTCRNTSSPCLLAASADSTHSFVTSLTFLIGQTMCFFMYALAGPNGILLET